MVAMEVLSFFAAYNRKANEAMTDILRKLPEETLQKDLGTYYKSIRETIEHMVMADLNWFTRAGMMIGGAAIAGSEIPSLSRDLIKEKSRDNTLWLLEQKSKNDRLLEAVVAGLDDEDLHKRIKYRTMRAGELERSAWHMILHILNHGTHHRGMIAAMLDILKIENDFSGILNYSE
jgi:uncharacterized damage-inducible protein DinB